MSTFSSACSHDGYCPLVEIKHLPDDKILALSKFKAFTDGKFNVTQIIKFMFHRAENIVGKKEMLVASIFFFSHNVF